MTEEKVVVVTGAAGYWGARLAGRLIAEGGLRVVGIDTRPPTPAVEGLDFVRADVRNPLLADLFKAEGVDTVCHLLFRQGARPDEKTFDLNVIGTMKLLGACQQAGVRKVVLKSSTAVYGAHPTNPAFLEESRHLQGSRRYADLGHQVEIEVLAQNFHRQAPEILLTILRFAHGVGPTADSPFTRFLRTPGAPHLLGFDPPLQLIHEDDVVEALAQAVLNDAPGVFNVAAEGVLPLTRILALAGKISPPVLPPLAEWGARLMATAGRPPDRVWPLEPSYLRYRCVADLTKMREELTFAPRYTAVEALQSFTEARQDTGQVNDLTAEDEERLRQTIAERQSQ
ncbi:MAG: NAD-dependent epimerase/dehydratase family protein [Chloroflexota bacterium]